MRMRLRVLGVVTVIVLMPSLVPTRADTLHVAGDTNINLGNPGQINGTATSILVRNAGPGGERHAYIRFDLSAMPVNSPINLAVVRLFAITVTDPGPVGVHPVLAPWDEATLSAATAPPVGPAVAFLNFALADQDDFVTAEITSLVQGWLNGSTANHGLALIPTLADPVRLALDSKEATNTSHGPELEVVPVGPKGDKGDMGIQGDKGEQGVKGDRGDDGVDGQNGQNGAPGLGIKAWVRFTAGGVVLASSEVASVVRNGVGDYTVTWTTPFVSENYVVNAIAQNATFVSVALNGQSAGSVRLFVHDGGGQPNDSIVSVLAIGD